MRDVEKIRKVVSGTIFKKFKVYLGPQYGTKQKSV